MSNPFVEQAAAIRREYKSKKEKLKQQNECIEYVKTRIEWAFKKGRGGAYIDGRQVTNDVVEQLKQCYKVSHERDGDDWGWWVIWDEETWKD